MFGRFILSLSLFFCTSAFEIIKQVFKKIYIQEEKIRCALDQNADLLRMAEWNKKEWHNDEDFIN